LAVAIVPYALYQIPLFSDDSGFFSQVIMQVVYERTIMTPGAVLGQYADFFTTHPHTYFTHVGLLSKLIPYNYPYNERLGYVIADYVLKHQTGGDIEYNANLFATDGIAALGNVGVVIIGIVLGFMLRVIDTFIRPALVPLGDVDHGVGQWLLVRDTPQRGPGGSGPHLYRLGPNRGWAASRARFLPAFSRGSRRDLAAMERLRAETAPLGHRRRDETGFMKVTIRRIRNDRSAGNAFTSRSYSIPRT
jgi:hypothetical protein